MIIKDGYRVVSSSIAGLCYDLPMKATRIKETEDVTFYSNETLLERNGVTVFSSNYALYGDMSNRVMSTLRAFSPSIEVYSIDEAFWDLSGMRCDLAHIQECWGIRTLLRRVFTMINARLSPESLQPLR